MKFNTSKANIISAVLGVLVLVSGFSSDASENTSSVQRDNIDTICEFDGNELKLNGTTISTSSYHEVLQISVDKIRVKDGLLELISEFEDSTTVRYKPLSEVLIMYTDSPDKKLIHTGGVRTQYIIDRMITSQLQYTLYLPINYKEAVDNGEIIDLR